MLKQKQLEFEFIKRIRKKAENVMLERAYEDLYEYFDGDEFRVYDRLTPYCQYYLDNCFNNNASASRAILESLSRNGELLGVTEISCDCFRDERTISSLLKKMCEKDVLGKIDNKYFIASKPLLNWMRFRNNLHPVSA